MQNSAVWALRNVQDDDHLRRLLPRMFARGRMYVVPLFCTTISDQQRVRIFVGRGHMSRVRKRFRKLALDGDVSVDTARFARTLYSVCAGCGTAMANKVCGRCREVHYCSSACQKRDWPKHRADCM